MAQGKSVVLETARLWLRPFTEGDARDLYEYASDPQVGPNAGWLPHRSEEESLEIIRTVFAAPDSFALVLKETGRVVGSAGFTGRHDPGLPGPEGEIGYALGREYWGRGLMPEAVGELLRYGFEDLGLASVWCSHYEDNPQSRRVIEKCGFSPLREGTIWDEPTGGEKPARFYALGREKWAERLRGGRGR